MEITYDPAKNSRNIAERGLSFDLVSEFDFDSAFTVIDDRKDYGEVRYRSLGLLNGRVHAVVFTGTKNGIRVISFRKANKREVRIYEQAH